MVERFGSVQQAIDATDTDGSYEVNYAQFLNLCFECQYRRNERRLFEYYGGKYGKEGSTIELERIDSDAVEKVKAKREKDEEDEAARREADKKRLQAASRRKK